jgi:hypothetical protein
MISDLLLAYVEFLQDCQDNNFTLTSGNQGYLVHNDGFIFVFQQSMVVSFNGTHLCVKSFLLEQLN